MNTTLSNFNLRSLKRKGANNQNDLMYLCCTDNDIGDEGAKAIAEALKVNPTLWHLNLFREWRMK